MGTPPSTHVAYCHMVLDAGKALWCEKPLAVNIAEAEQLVARISTQKSLSAVNLSLATNPVVAKLSALISEPQHGDIVNIAMNFHYSSWPRHWQKNASKWLSSKEQGGFLREVFSHFVFIHHRLIGELVLENVYLEYDEELGFETLVQASYQSHGIKVRVSGGIGGCSLDQNEWTLNGTKQSIRYADWNNVSLGNQAGWHQLDIPAVSSVKSQLSEVEKMIKGQPHKLASFAEALSV